MSKPMISSQERSVAGVPQHHNAAHPSPCVSTEPTHDEIAKCAYEIYVKSGRTQGQCARNWDHAEQSLREVAQANRRAMQANTGALGAHAPAAR